MKELDALFYALCRRAGVLGTGDVVGPAGATPGGIAVFADNTGKEIAQGPPLSSVAFSGAYSDLSGIPSGSTIMSMLMGEPDRFVRTSELPPVTPGGDVFGPSSSTAGRMAVFADATGKVLQVGAVPFNGQYGSLSGIPSSYNPQNHASRHASGGADMIRLHELGAPTSPVAMSGQRLTGLASPSAANDAVSRSFLEASYVRKPSSATVGRMAVFAHASGNLLGEGPPLAAVAISGSFSDLSGFYTANGLSTYLDSATDPFLRTSALPPASPGSGDVTGPSSSVDGRPALFDGASGKLLKQGAALGSAAYMSTGSTAGTVAAGDDPRFASLPVSQPLQLQSYATMTGEGVYDLGIVYGLSRVNGSLKLNQLYTTGQAQSKFAKFFQWYTAAGRSVPDLMNVRHGVACHNEAVLQGHAMGNIGSGRIFSRNAVLWPKGCYHINMACVTDAGWYIGRGTTPNFGPGEGTTLVLDKAGWLGTDPMMMNLFENSIGADWGTYSYSEGGWIDGFRFEGLAGFKYHDPSYRSTGIWQRGAGEVFVIGRIATIGFNGYGLTNFGGTPLQVDYISTFSNTLGGIGNIGTSLSTNRFGVVSGDDNPCLFRCEEGPNGERSGGVFEVGLIKDESGHRSPPRAQIIMEADGMTGPNNNEGSLVSMKIGSIQYYVEGGGRSHAMFVVRGFAAGVAADYSGPRRARIQVDSVYNWGVDNFVHCLGTKRSWATDGDHDFSGFIWNARTGTFWKSTADGPAPSPQSVNGTRRLGIRTNQPNWGSVPPYDETGGGTVIPDPPFGGDWVHNVDIGILPSEITQGQTAQASALGINADYRLRPESATWYIVSGPATINSAGVITPTGTGMVRVKGIVVNNEGEAWLKVNP